MEVIQIIKKLNNTELGKKNTHESYILVNRGLDISDLSCELSAAAPANLPA